MKRYTFAALLFLSSASGAWGACGVTSITVKDGGGSSQVFCIGGGAGALINQTQLVDSTGANILGVNASGQLTISNSSFAVTQATAANLNATVVGTGTFAVQAAQSGTWNLTNISGTISLPTGAATSALQTTGNTALTTINTTLGSPFQAGGSIGNTSFAATQTTAANLNATVVGGSGAALATSANQTNANQKTQVVDGSGNVIGSTANALNIDCVAGCSASGTTVTASGGSAASLAGQVAGVYNSTPLSLSNGQGAALQLDTNGLLIISPTNLSLAQASTTAGQSGSLIMGAVTTAAPSYTTAKTYPLSLDTNGNTRVLAVGTGTFAVQDSTTETNTGTIAGAVSGSLMQDNVVDWAGTALGAMANYGTSPGAVKVPGVNAYITNTPSVSGSGVFEVGPTTSANTAANPFFNNLSIGGSSVSSTNGEYTNLLQGNAVLSSTNPIFTELSDGTHLGTIKAASTGSVAGDTSLVVQLSPNQSSLTSALNVSIPANSSVNVNQVGGSGVSTAASGVQKVGIVGNTGSTIDSAPGAAATSAVNIQGEASMTPVQVTTAPVGATTTMTGSNISTQNTFQSVLASSSTRKGATVQNTSGSDILYVFFGANASATKATSFQISPGQTINAATLTGIVLTDNISATCADATPTNCTYVVGAQ